MSLSFLSCPISNLSPNPFMSQKYTHPFFSVSKSRYSHPGHLLAQILQPPLLQCSSQFSFLHSIQDVVMIKNYLSHCSNHITYHLKFLRWLPDLAQPYFPSSSWSCPFYSSIMKDSKYTYPLAHDPLFSGSPALISSKVFCSLLSLPFVATYTWNSLSWLPEGCPSFAYNTVGPH